MTGASVGALRTFGARMFLLDLLGTTKSIFFAPSSTLPDCGESAIVRVVLTPRRSVGEQDHSYIVKQAEGGLSKA